jgi:putative transcriptional regulator
MAIIINIDVMLAKRKMSVTELAEKVGITMANISVLKNGKAKAIRLSTLEAICKALECQPGDILEYKNGTCVSRGDIGPENSQNKQRVGRTKSSEA